MPPTIANQFHVFFGRDVGRAAKHHVLEHVRKALAVGPFIAAAHVVNHAHMNHRRLVQRRVDHAKAVAECLLLVFDLVGSLYGG